VETLQRLNASQHFHYHGNMKETEAVLALAALAQESRLALYRLLVRRGPEGYAAGEIAERLRIPGPTLSFHLKALAQAGLVDVRRESRFIRYSPNIRRMNALVGFLTENCCSLASDCAPDSCAPPRASPRRRAG
jgi:ArsR family transcriptional regulator, arsenate/arsenite/antimonite-responsive transcriptional repressor